MLGCLSEPPPLWTGAMVRSWYRLTPCTRAGTRTQVCLRMGAWCWWCGPCARRTATGEILLGQGRCCQLLCPVHQGSRMKLCALLMCAGRNGCRRSHDAVSTTAFSGIIRCILATASACAAVCCKFKRLRARPLACKNTCVKHTVSHCACEAHGCRICLPTSGCLPTQQTPIAHLRTNAA